MTEITYMGMLANFGLQSMTMLLMYYMDHITGQQHCANCHIISYDVTCREI